MATMLDQARQQLKVAQRKVDRAEAELARLVKSRDKAQQALDQAEAVGDLLVSVETKDMSAASAALAKFNRSGKHERGK